MPATLSTPNDARGWSTDEVIAAATERGLHAEVVGTGGNCRAVQITTGEQDGREVLVTDGDAQVPDGRDVDAYVGVYDLDGDSEGVEVYYEEGTATVVGIVDAAEVALRVDGVLQQIHDKVIPAADGPSAFLCDSGGWLDYVGVETNDLVAAAAIRRIEDEQPVVVAAREVGLHAKVVYPEPDVVVVEIRSDEHFGTDQAVIASDGDDGLPNGEALVVHYPDVTQGAPDSFRGRTILSEHKVTAQQIVAAATKALRRERQIRVAVEQGKREILADLGTAVSSRGDVMPPTVSSFSELHDYVDANYYGGLCDDDTREDLGLDDTEEWMHFGNDLQDRLDAWLKAGRPMPQREIPVSEAEAGMKVTFAATLNSYGFTGTIVSVTPWMLSAGPYAGRQATSKPRGKGDPLFTVEIHDVALTDPPKLGGDELADSPVRLMALTADHLLTVEVVR